MAVTSVIQICNLALLRLGADTITSLDDGTVATNLLTIYYDQCREELLREHFWNFAVSRVSLASSGAPAFGFSYQYQLPSDFLRVKEIHKQCFSFSIEGQTIVTNQAAPLNLIYVRDESDPTKYDALFVRALVLSIAIKCGTRIKGDGFNPQALENELDRALFTAKMVDAQDGTAPRIKANTFLNSRNTGSSEIIGDYFYMDY